MISLRSLRVLLWAAIAAGGLALAVGLSRPSRSRDETNEVPLIAIQPFELIDQRGEVFQSSALTGKVWVVGFAFTSCTSACPLLTSQMANLQRRVEALGTHFQLLTVTVDPDVDTPERLAAFAERYHADLANWSFLTGQPDAVRGVIRERFMVPIGERIEIEGGYDILHSAHLLLVDRQGMLRGVYPTTDLDGLQAEIERLARE